MKIRIAAVTDIGKERTNNEDAFVFCPDLERQDWSQSETQTYISLGRLGALIVVADGMGGANAGEKASAIAMKSVKSVFSKENVERHFAAGSFEELLVESIKTADDGINKKIDEDPRTMGMGTTIVICWIIGNKVFVAWCGDSRCYLYNPIRGLKLLTKDHSLVQEMVSRGEISEDEAFAHPDNNVITRGLGDVMSAAEPEVVSQQISANDELLLCSDGLCGYCRDKAIERVLDYNYKDVKKSRDELIRISLEAGGFDNVSIAMASVVADDQESPSVLTKKQKFRRLLRLLQ